MFFFAAPGTAPTFAKTFGWMSALGVTLQLLFPCTPPWYENEHGLVPAAYGMQGSPAGLARVDKILGVDLYTSSFTAAPVPFGAFPSLHAADSVLEALFMSYCFPRLRGVFIVYVAWMWWATMYLSHHYAVDLVGGSLIAAAFFYTVKSRWLPQRQPGKSTRWEYEYVEFGEKRRSMDEEYGSLYPLGMLLERRGTSDSDEWTVGSSSSYDSRSSGSMSPSLPESPRRDAFVVEMTPQGSLWDGERVGRESELSEVVLVR
jgi:inositol phosphorylceramide synthase catalytic subunit